MIMGYRLRQLRKSNHMSQEELGLKLDVSKVSISGYETGNRIPSLEVFVKLLDIFNISSDYLLGREIEMVCENSDDNVFYASKIDIEILKSLKKRNDLYSLASNNPNRFFSSFNDKK